MFNVGEHTAEHHPVHRSRCHAAAHAAEFRHAKMTVNVDIVHGNVHQQADKAHHHARLGFCQPFTLVTCHLEEQIAGRAPEQGAQITDRLIRQRRVDIMHGANNIPGVPQDDHNQDGDTPGQPEALAHLMGHAVASTGAVKLRDNGRQRQQQAVTKKNGRKPD